MSNLSTVPACDFGEELRRLRTSAGLTLRSFAERVTFDYSYLAQVERGDRPGSMKLAYRCDQALNACGRLVRLFADRQVRQSQRVAVGRADAHSTPPDPTALTTGSGPL